MAVWKLIVSVIVAAVTYLVCYYPVDMNLTGSIVAGVIMFGLMLALLFTEIGGAILEGIGDSMDSMGDSDGGDFGGDD